MLSQKAMGAMYAMDDGISLCELSDDQDVLFSFFMEEK
jgi:hypothetical protein